MEQFESQDYSDAIKTFTALKERYPYSRYAILAELKLADAYFQREEYPQAIAAYEDFSRLHPKNEAIPYVLYQIGESHYRQLLSVDRDQSATKQAILAFERLVKSYPQCSYASKAEEKIQNCRKLLAEHEVYVGRFYYKSEHYRAALARFKGVLDDYGDVCEPGQLRQIQELIVACKEKLVDMEASEEGVKDRPSATPMDSMFENLP